MWTRTPPIVCSRRTTLPRHDAPALIHRLNAVKREETRTRKIGEFVAMLARGETPYPQKAKPSR